LKRFFSFFVVFILLSGAFTACKTTQPSAYFTTLTKDTTIIGATPNDYESTIQKGDQLSIAVTSLSPTEDAIFNQGAATSTSPALTGFTVYPDGSVLLHRLGRVKVEGLTRRQLAAKLEKDLLPYMKEPIVNVGYMNHKVTVIGEVGGPQIIQMPEEQLSLLEVLVKSGGIKSTGLANKVMIIREQGNNKQVKYVNMEDHSIFNSEWYYVKPNDIVYVKNDEKQRLKAEKSQKLQTTISLVMTGLSFFFIVIDRIFR
jgi:polysaccharide export outer membrane protein